MPTLNDQQRALVAQLLTTQTASAGAEAVAAAKQLGMSRQEAVAALEEARRQSALRAESTWREDILLEVLDHVVGWCRAELRLWPEDDAPPPARG
jgi:hypothetical protein